MTMIDPDLIQQYYSQLSNQELIDLTRNEGARLTGDAIDFLFDEFVKRDLDPALLQQIVEMKDRNRSIAEIGISYWNYAINAKRIGKSDVEIRNDLIARQVGQAEAALIVKRLPDFEYSNEEFDHLITTKCENTSVGGIFKALFFFGVGSYLLYTGIAGFFYLLPILLGLAAIIYSVYIWRRYDSDFKGGDYWAELINTKPEDVVWIKPIVTKRKDGNVPGLFRENKFHLFTQDGLRMGTTLANDEERQVFFEGVKHLLPHAHIGYTSEIDALYFSNSENFITKLEERKWYTPIDTFEVEA